MRLGRSMGRQNGLRSGREKQRREKDHVGGEGCLEVSGFYCNGVDGF